jgi:hypothetical protein
VKPLTGNADNKPNSCDFWQVNQAGNILANQACTLGARHIKDGILRLQFNREVAYYARGILHDVEQGKKTPEQGLRELKNEQNSLLSQSLDIAQKGVGAIAGGLQFIAGAGICYGSAGTLCVFLGAPLMAHGANNAYENGRNLWEERSDTQGPVRQGYQNVAKMMGAGEFEGNMAYGGADLLMSAYGVSRLVLKPDAWRLFRYVRSDYQRAYIEASKKALGFGMVSDGVTINSLYLENKRRAQ